jgi:nitrite reductase/ring-hydroxylating ferredoxin subunit
VPVPSRKFRLTLPETLAPGDVFVPRPSVAIFSDASGVFTMSTICTHLGCIVKEGDGFACPCHGSVRSTAASPGARAEGSRVAVTKVADGGYVVDESKTVAAGTKIAV